jgi:uncharacterized protein HemX
VAVPTETEAGPTSPSAAPAASESSGGGSDPALRAVQLAVVIALLLALIGGVGLYLTREHG